MQYQVSDDISEATRFLSDDVFANLVTLKMLNLYPNAVSTALYRNGTEWACRSELHAAASAWDHRAYPGIDLVVMLDGNSPSLLRQAIKDTPAVQVVFKVHDRWSSTYLQDASGFNLAQSFLSYTATAGEIPVLAAAPPGVERHSEYSDQAAFLFAKNGYTPDELQHHFARDAKWFGIRESGRIVSVCMVYPNYHPVWEIGGVYTVPAFRRRGLAARVVRAAIETLFRQGLKPRYQLHYKNTGSMRLAEALGLKLALTVDHFISTGTNPPE